MDRYLALAVYAGTGFTVFIAGLLWNKYGRPYTKAWFGGGRHSEPRHSDYHMPAR